MTTTHPQQPAQSASSASTRSQRRERQTRLQEHLRAVKPGSRSSSPNSGGINSKQQPPLTTTTTTSSMGRSTSRKSTPSAKKAAAAAAVVPEPVQATTATGRPKRRAAKARVALADLQSSDDEGVGTSSTSGPAEVTTTDAPDPAEEEAKGESSLASATPTRSTVGKARSQARQPIPLSRQPSLDDLAPSTTTTTTTTRNSVGRKSPAKQIQSAAAQRRKREVSGGSSSQTTSAQPSPSPYQTDPGLMQKHQFRSVLAQHGFNPEEEVLERAIQTISSSKQEFTVDTFLRVLGTLDTNVSPLKRSTTTTTGVPQQLSVSVSRSSKHSSGGGFSALESPLTPSSIVADGRFLPSPPLSSSPAGRSHHPGSGSYCTAGVYRQSPASATFPPLPPQSQSDTLPVPPPPRPTLYAHRSVSAPSLPTLESTMRSQASTMAGAQLPVLHEMPAPLQSQPAATSSSSAGSAGAGGLFATSVAGMGRVALSRRSMFGQLGSTPAPTLAMTSHVDPTPTMSFHQLSPPPRASPAPLTPTTSGLLPAFAVGAPGSTAQKTTRSRASSTSKSSSPAKATDDARLAKLRSWLDDDEEETTEEEEGGKAGAADATLEAEASLKASAANGKLATSLSALDGVLNSLEMRAQATDVEDSKPELAGPAAEIRVGGKNVSILRQSQKRQLDEVTATVEESESPAKMATRAATRASSSSKGKGKAQHACVCGEGADEQPRTIACAECDVAYHLACLNATSARQLPSPFVCSRCVTVSPPAPAEPALAAGQRTPELASKRVRIGTTSTPRLLSEPTFVASTPLSAPRVDAFGPLVADLALAPSPTASPVRRFASARAPVSPVHQRAQLPIPTTPRLGDALIRGPGDYSPTSPQNTRSRASRTRLVSNTGAAFFGGNGAEWLETWDQHQFPVADSMQAQAPSSAMSSLAEDDWRMPSWSDVNMTPSRALSSATPATSSSSSVWDTPFVHSSPQARRTHSQGPYMLGHHARTPSQDLMAMLDREHASEPAHHSYSQRLFDGGPGSAGDLPTFEGGLQHSMMPLGHPLSPLNPRRQPSAFGHARKQSLGDGLGRAPFAYPHSPAHAHSYLPPSHMPGLGSAGMKPSFSAPGGRLVDLMPSLNYVEQQQLDDLLL